MLRRLVRRLFNHLRPMSPAPGRGDRPGPPDDDIRWVLRRRDYPGSRDRVYLVHRPRGHDPARPLPLVMVLHGCHEDHEVIRRDTDFNRIADREGFLVVYPDITSYAEPRSSDCWGFWLDQHIHRGGGEVQDLAEIIREVRREFRVDPDRIHIAGLSSGAAMAMAALVAHPNLFASGVSTAGVPYSETPTSVSASCSNPGVFKPLEDVVAAMDAEMGDRKRPVPILVIHSTGDCQVHIRASERIRDSWGLAFGVDTTSPAPAVSGVTKGTRWTRSQYADPQGRTVVETLFVDGLPHGWHGDRDGKFAFSKAPDTAELAWEFFKVHPLNPDGREADRQQPAEVG